MLPENPVRASRFTLWSSDFLTQQGLSCDLILAEYLSPLSNTSGIFFFNTNIPLYLRLTGMWSVNSTAGVAYMPLLDLSIEILDYILSQDVSLHSRDFYHLTLTCRRMYLVALPFILRNLIVSSAPPRHTTVWPMENLIQHFDRYPNRLQWVHVASTSWWRGNPVPAAKLLSLVSRFSSIHTIKMRACGGGFEDPFPPFLDGCKSLPSLQHAEIDNPLLESDHVMKLYGIPSLDRLVLWNFQVPDDAAFIPWPACPTSTLTRLEVLRTNELPMGHCVNSIFRGIPKLKTLVWTLQTYRFTRQFRPAKLSLAFAPLKASLVELHLSLENSEGFRNDDQIDFSDFTALRSLEVHERVTLAGNVTATNPQHQRSDLPSRLPSSLEYLKIFFDRNSAILRVKPSEPVDFNWILAIAHHKQEASTQLLQVVLTESGFRPIFQRTKTDFDDVVEWVYPPEVGTAFQKAGVHLKVMLGASQA